MRFDSMDITLESHNKAIWLKLSGPFRKDQIPTMREKFIVLLEDGNRLFVVDLENITVIDEQVIQMFLQLLNVIKGKGGDIKLIFKNEIIVRAFAPYHNLFPIFPDTATLTSGGFLNALRHRSKILSKKTGIRISRPVAIVFLTVLCGWFSSLIFIIHLQSGYVKRQQIELHALSEYNQQAKLQIDKLKERMKPLEQLGVLKDAGDNKK